MPENSETSVEDSSQGRIHPIVIYPYVHPESYQNLESLYDLIEHLGQDTDNYVRPITVIDRKTHLSKHEDEAFQKFRASYVEQHSDVIDAWCVDTCQMWYSGLGKAYENGSEGDIYWLIPGDFNYGSKVGKAVLSRLSDLPETVLELQEDICVGEIETDHNHSKQLIDNYGTFALLYHWFPLEANAIRQITERPRSEFFAIGHAFLGELLVKRWFPYEQTVVMLLDAVRSNKRISRFFVGNVSDLPEGRDSFSSAMQQIERTERVLKMRWREEHESDKDWMTSYLELERKSEEIRRTAWHILTTLLK